jgi:hypothetical protein
MCFSLAQEPLRWPSAVFLVKTLKSRLYFDWQKQAGSNSLVISSEMHLGSFFPVVYLPALSVRTIITPQVGEASRNPGTVASLRKAQLSALVAYSALGSAENGVFLA